MCVADLLGKLKREKYPKRGHQNTVPKSHSIQFRENPIGTFTPECFGFITLFIFVDDASDRPAEILHKFLAFFCRQYKLYTEGLLFRLATYIYIYLVYSCCHQWARKITIEEREREGEGEGKIYSIIGSQQQAGTKLPRPDMIGGPPSCRPRPKTRPTSSFLWRRCIIPIKPARQADQGRLYRLHKKKTLHGGSPRAHRYRRPATQVGVG